MNNKLLIIYNNNDYRSSLIYHRFLSLISFIFPTSSISHFAAERDEYFRGKGFYYIHAPIITGSDAEGAGQMFQVTTLDLANPPRVAIWEAELARP